MGAATSRLQLVDRTQLLIGCGTAAVILLYFRIVGKGGDHKPTPKQHPRNIRFHQDEPNPNYSSLPKFVSEESFASERTGVSSLPSSSHYPAEDYNYFVTVEDGREQVPVVAHPRSIPTIQAKTLYRSSNSEVGSQTCHRDFSLPPSREGTRRNAPPTFTNLRRPNSTATTTQTCSRDRQMPEPTINDRPTRTSQWPNRRERESHRPKSMPEETQTCRLHHAPPVTRQNYYHVDDLESRESIFAVPPITVSTAFPYPSLPSIVPDEGLSTHVINQQSEIYDPYETSHFQLPLGRTESETTDTDKQVKAHQNSTVSMQTSVTCHHHFHFPENASASTQTGKMKSVIATQTSVMCHHHFELPAIPPENVASVTTQTEKLKSVIATQTSVVCHHHYQLPILPSASMIEEHSPTSPSLQDFSACAPTLIPISTNNMNQVAPRSTTPSYLEDFSENDIEEPTSIPISTNNMNQVAPRSTTPSYLEDFSDNDTDKTTSRPKSVRIAPRNNKTMDDSSEESDYFEPKIIDSKPSMKVEDQRLFDHDTLPEIQPSTYEKQPKPQLKSRRDPIPKVDTSHTSFWSPVKSPSKWRPKPDKGKGKPKKIIIERQPRQEDGQ